MIIGELGPIEIEHIFSFIIFILFFTLVLPPISFITRNTAVPCKSFILLIPNILLHFTNVVTFLLRIL